MRKVIEDKNTMSPSEFIKNKVYCFKVGSTVYKLNTVPKGGYFWSQLDGTSYVWNDYEYGTSVGALEDAIVSCCDVYEFDTIREALDYFEVE